MGTGTLAGEALVSMSLIGSKQVIREAAGICVDIGLLGIKKHLLVPDDAAQMGIKLLEIKETVCEREKINRQNTCTIN